MRIKIKYSKHFRTVCVTMLLLIFAGCTKNKLDEFAPGNATGKVVMVSLKVSLPPAVEPISTDRHEVVKSFFRDRNTTGSSFAVVLERGQGANDPTTRASDSATPLHNLWLFQFNENGSINGKPHKLSDTETSINDLVTIDVPLVVAENQTLYLLVLGPKLNNYDMSGVSTLDGLKKWSFEYLTNIEGHTQSLITTDHEVPFAGEVSGVTVVDIDGGNRGLVEYNKPIGFVGGIEIKRLMARITLRYQFEVEGYQLQGLKLLNVNNTIRLANPDKNTNGDTYATLETVQFDGPDSNGFYSATWYVAQNHQGTVGTILSENQRYYKVVNNVALGAAPPLRTQIEAWANATSGNKYAIYQMYVGNNNTDNFDVTTNHFYNLRTTINADINSAKNDERIRAYTASQYVGFYASQNIKVAGGASFNTSLYNKSGKDYDLDAAYDVRPMVIQTQGRTVEVGIYTDKECTQPASPKNSWLRLSSSSNYTDAYNNVKEPLNTYIKAGTVLPTQVKFYLYNDEYIYDENNKLVDSGESDANGKRSLYIKVTTTTEGDGTSSQAYHIFRMDQRPAVYAGCFGGGKKDGNYTMGLVHDRLPVRSSDKYIEGITVGGVQYGYDKVGTATSSYGTDDMDYGKAATVNLAENIKDLSWAGDVPVPQKDASGHVLLYQYQYPVLTFSARVCYDKNRDEDGNGRIEGEEIKWYLPASNQMLGFYVGSLIGTEPNGATTEDGSVNVKRWSSGLNSYSKHQTGSSKCVRDIPPLLDNTQAIGVYTDDRGNKYAAIKSIGLPENRVENRNENENFYTNIQLYKYTANGQNTEPVKDESGNYIFVNRTARHTNDKTPSRTDWKVSEYFIISPDIVYSDGNNSDGKNSGEPTMNWATANGYLATANSNLYNTESFAVPKGCAMYSGKDGKDEPGTWRVPTFREGSLIMIYYKELEATAVDKGTEFQPFARPNLTSTTYWTATEKNSASYAWKITFFPDNTKVKYSSDANNVKSTKYYLRCVRDIP